MQTDIDHVPTRAELAALGEGRYYLFGYLLYVRAVVETFIAERREVVVSYQCPTCKDHAGAPLRHSHTISRDAAEDCHRRRAHCSGGPGFRRLPFDVALANNEAALADEVVLFVPQ